MMQLNLGDLSLACSEDRADTARLGRLWRVSDPGGDAPGYCGRKAKRIEAWLI